LEAPEFGVVSNRQADRIKGQFMILDMAAAKELGRTFATIVARKKPVSD
jgi:hypothetical protein